MSIEIIDFHMHPFLSSSNNFCMYKENLEMDYNTVIKDMEEAGVSTFCGSVISGSLENGFETLQKCNQDALKLREIYGEKYIPGFHVHPNYIEESFKELEFASQNNVKLIGELVPYMNGWDDYSCKEFSLILDEIEKYNMVVSLHTINFEKMEKMASQHKNVKFVFAHPGEKPTVINHIEVMKKLDNVYLDISGGGIHRYGVIKHLINNVGAERILFGTDYPLGNVKSYVSAVLGEKITDREKELIFSGNAKNLLLK